MKNTLRKAVGLNRQPATTYTERGFHSLTALTGVHPYGTPFILLAILLEMAWRHRSMLQKYGKPIQGQARRPGRVSAVEENLSALIIGTVQRKTVTSIDTEGEALDFTRYEFALVGDGRVLGTLAYSDQSEAERSGKWF